MEGVDANPPESITMVDRISDLSDHVAHHILSYLTITHLASFECVSKRCQELCLSSPSLNLDGFSTPKGCSEQRKLVDCLERFLFRRGDNKIKCFRVRWFDHYVCPSFVRLSIFGFALVYVRMLSWIRNAVSCNVEELDIHIHIGREGIEKLVLKDLIVETITIESSSLKTLYIEENQLYIDGDDSFCILNISGQKLENIHICWRTRNPERKSLNISAPSLRSSAWKGSLMNHPSLSNLELLEEAAVFLNPKVDVLDQVFKLFCSLRKAKLLFVKEPTIGFCYRQALGKGSMAAALDDASYLHIHIESFVD